MRLCHGFSCNLVYLIFYNWGILGKSTIKLIFCLKIYSRPISFYYIRQIECCCWVVLETNGFISTWTVSGQLGPAVAALWLVVEVTYWASIPALIGCIGSDRLAVLVTIVCDWVREGLIWCKKLYKETLNLIILLIYIRFT